LLRECPDNLHAKTFDARGRVKIGRKTFALITDRKLADPVSNAVGHFQLSTAMFKSSELGDEPVGHAEKPLFPASSHTDASKHRANMAFTFEELLKELHGFPIQKPSTASTQREVSLSSR
jgi:hypothetical protein